MKYIRWKYPFWLCVGAIILFSRDSLYLARMGLVAAVLHETGHALAYRRLVGRWPTVKVTPAGFGIELPDTLLTPKELLVLTLAGPAVNLALAVLLWLAMQVKATYPGYCFAAVNLGLGSFNLLPFGQLDGHRILQHLSAMKNSAE